MIRDSSPRGVWTTTIRTPEEVHAYSDKALLALGTVVFGGDGKGITKHAVAFGERHAMLLDVCRILNSADTQQLYARYAYMSTQAADPVEH